MSQQRNTRAESTLRKAKYKQILTQGGELAEQSDGKSAFENLLTVTRLMTECNVLADEGKTSDRIGQTSEVVLDAQVLKMSSDMLATTVQKIENVQFSDDLYANALLKLVRNGNEPHDWSRLDDMVNASMRTAWYSQPMYGTFDMSADAAQPEATQRPRQQRARNPLGVEKKVQSMSQRTGKPKKGEKITSIMKQIEALYIQRGKKPLPYFKVIIDPDNMSNSVDNAFSISFLFRDSHIGFTKGDDNMPAIYPVPPNERSISNGPNKQFIATFNQDLLQKMIEKYNITEPLLQVDRDVPDENPE